MSLASAHLQTRLAKSHVNEAGIGIRTMRFEYLTDAYRSLRILCHHIEIASATGTRQLISKAKVVNEVGKLTHAIWISTAVHSLVLRPGLTAVWHHTYLRYGISYRGASKARRYG